MNAFAHSSRAHTRGLIHFVSVCLVHAFSSERERARERVCVCERVCVRALGLILFVSVFVYVCVFAHTHKHTCLHMRVPREGGSMKTVFILNDTCCSSPLVPQEGQVRQPREVGRKHRSPQKEGGGAPVKRRRRYTPGPSVAPSRRSNRLREMEVTRTTHGSPSDSQRRGVEECANMEGGRGTAGSSDARSPSPASSGGVQGSRKRPFPENEPCSPLE
jgi:hypothetical protein